MRKEHREKALEACSTRPISLPLGASLRSHLVARVYPFWLVYALSGQNQVDRDRVDLADYPPSTFLQSPSGRYDSPSSVCCLVHKETCDLVTRYHRESEIGRGQNFSVNVIKAERDVRE